MGEIDLHKCHPMIEPFISVVHLLGSMLGKEYEIVLHDVSSGESEVVALENGELTGRSYDSPMTDFGNFLMTSPEAENLDYFANYPSKAANGRTLRSGVSLIRDEKKKLIGFLCINYDMTKANMLKDMGSFLTATQPLSFNDIVSENIGSMDDEKSMMEEARRKFGKPLAYLTSNERKQCLKYMNDAGFFKLKGSVEALADEMEKSRYTLYADLRQLRNDK